MTRTHQHQTAPDFNYEPALLDHEFDRYEEEREIAAYEARKYAAEGMN